MPDLRKRWADLNRAKFERVAGALPGLSFRAAAGTFRISFDNGAGLNEAVVIGAPPRIKVIPETARRTMLRKAVKLSGKRVRSNDSKTRVPGVDLDDDLIDAVIDCWRRGESAKTLKTVRVE